jgi:hypothetical protein
VQLQDEYNEIPHSKRRYHSALKSYAVQLFTEKRSREKSVIIDKKCLPNIFHACIQRKGIDQFGVVQIEIGMSSYHIRIFYGMQS